MVRLSYVQLDWNHEICSFFQLTDAVLFSNGFHLENHIQFELPKNLCRGFLLRVSVVQTLPKSLESPVPLL